MLFYKTMGLVAISVLMNSMLYAGTVVRGGAEGHYDGYARKIGEKSGMPQEDVYEAIEIFRKSGKYTDADLARIGREKADFNPARENDLLDLLRSGEFKLRAGLEGVGNEAIKKDAEKAFEGMKDEPLALSASRFAGQVTYDGKPGASKNYDYETNGLLGAIRSNWGDFVKLTADARYVLSAEVQVFPSKDPENYSDVTQYTLVARPRGSFMGPPPTEKGMKLILRRYFNKHIMDDAPTIWESSGVVTVDGSVPPSSGAKTYDWDTQSLLEAISANSGDFSKLTADNRFVLSAKVEILASKDPEIFSDITQYTIVAGPRGSFLGHRPVGKDVVLVLRSYFNKQIMDDVPTIWESSGVLPKR